MNKEKYTRWAQLTKKARKTGDRLGMGIDDGILTVVVGLWAHGIKTTGSCEGHMDHGSPYPWIRVETFPPEKWGDINKWWKNEKKKRQLLKKNRVFLARLNSLLTEFYSKRRVRYEDQLIVSGVNTFVGTSYLEPLEANIAVLLFSKTNQKKRLRAFQKEMNSFGIFLKKKFFSS